MGPPVIGPQGGPASARMGSSYKTSICKSWAESGNCQYGGACLFAHGEGEKRSEGQQYKTSLCKNWESSGTVTAAMDVDLFMSDSGKDLKCFYSVSGETSASGLMVERISEQAGRVSLVEEVGQVLIEHGLYEQIPRWGRWTVKLGREQWPIQNSPLLKVGSGETRFGLMFFVDNL